VIRSVLVLEGIHICYDRLSVLRAGPSNSTGKLSCTTQLSFRDPTHFTATRGKYEEPRPDVGYLDNCNHLHAGLKSEAWLCNIPLGELHLFLTSTSSLAPCFVQRTASKFFLQMLEFAPTTGAQRPARVQDTACPALPSRMM
jgi:hypothetical protein